MRSNVQRRAGAGRWDWYGCTVRSNASWVMVTWVLRVSNSLAGGKKQLVGFIYKEQYWTE